MTSKANNPKDLRNGCLGIIITVIVAGFIYDKCTSQKGRVVEVYDAETGGSKSRTIGGKDEDVVTQDDSRINTDNGLPDESPDRLDMHVVTQYFLKTKVRTPSTIEVDLRNFSVNYLEKDKIYIMTGSVEYMNEYNAPIKRHFITGLQYLGGKPNVKRSWIEESFEWLD